MQYKYLGSSPVMTWVRWSKFPLLRRKPGNCRWYDATEPGAAFPSTQPILHAQQTNHCLALEPQFAPLVIEGAATDDAAA